MFRVPNRKAHKHSRFFGIPAESCRQRVRCRNSASVFQTKVFICSCQSQPLHANCSSASVTTASSQAWPATIYCGTLAYKKCRIKRQYFLVYPSRVELETGRVGGDYSIQLNYGYMPLYFILNTRNLQGKLLSILQNRNIWMSCKALCFG